MDFEIIAGEVIRALRGRRSQTAFSRRLGYRSNVVYRWESGRAWPTAVTVFKAARKLGIELKTRLRDFYRNPPAPFEEADLTTTEGVARMLRDLRGSTPVSELAKRTGHSRFAIARWLKGTAEPRLPELLRMVEGCSLRLLDWLCILVDPAQLPSTARLWAELQAGRESAYSMPWSHAVLRALELQAYEALERHEPGWIARRLGISAEEEQRCLELLSRTRQIRKLGPKWVLDRSRAVDTRADPERSRQVKDWWTRLALERIQAGNSIVSSYNLFSVARADLERVREAYYSFFQHMRTIIAASEPNEEVVLFTAHMVPLSLGPRRTATPTPLDQDLQNPR